MDPVEIRTDRLLLRPWQPADAPAVLAAGGDPLVRRWIGDEPPTADRARRYVEEAAPAGWAADTAYAFAIIEAADGTVLGDVTLRRAGPPGIWSVGYWSAPAGRGTGAVTEAVRAVCRWGFDELGAQRVEWRAPAGNWASRRVAEKAGFTVEATLRSGLARPDGRVDAWLGARLPGDPEADTRRLPSFAPLGDGVVRLRPWRLDDAADVARACDDPQTARFLPVPSPYTLQDGQHYVGQVVPQQWADGVAANVAVTDPGTGALLGAVGVRLELRQHGVGEVGYWTAPEARGRGVAGRAARLHAQWALDALGLHRVELLADVHNTASQRAADKGGFRREGVARQARPDRTGTPRDMVVSALTAADRSDGSAGTPGAVSAS